MTSAATKKTTPNAFLRIKSVGLSGVLVSFSDTLTESANRAALAFRAELEETAPPGIIETTTSLTSTFVAFDPVCLPLEDLRAYLSKLLSRENWETATLPERRRLWRIPAVFGGEYGPQLEEAAKLAGLTPERAVEELTSTRLRVMTIGFAPGQPYLGSLPENWDIPRQSGLTKQVPNGAIAVAIRQLVLFTTETPTGWRQVGRTAFRGFRPESDTPFALRPGDEVQFTPIDEETCASIRAKDRTGDGGATWELLP